MGNLDNAEADDKLDERLWGDEDEDDDEDTSSKTEETGPGMDEVSQVILWCLFFSVGDDVLSLRL